jgi:uncharacterized protein (DUF885 family)
MIRRTHRLLAPAVFCAVAICACGDGTPAARAPSHPADEAAARALAIADAVVDDQLAHAPEAVTQLRIPAARYDWWDDESPAEVARVEARQDAQLAGLASIDRARLGDSSAGLAYDIAKETLESRRQARVCRLELWGTLRPLGNLLTRLADTAEAQPVGTPDLRAQALSRFSRVPALLDTHVANLREGMRSGYLQADVNVRQLLEQTERLAQASAESSPFYEPAERDGDPEFRAKMKTLIAESIAPAIRRYHDFLETEYLPHARKAIGVSANPRGNECYLAEVRLSTTLALTPKEVHESGLAELARVEAEMKALSVRSFGGADLATLRDRFRSSPEYLHHDADSVMRQAKDTIARARAAMPRAFGILPPADVVVEPIPKFQERTAAAHYLRAALDGSRPGTYRIRLYKAEEQSTVLGESTAFHEAIPGHHLQVDIAMTRADNPRAAKFLFNSGYGEGWALYAERLADELGLYSSEAARFGMLSNAAWRACRLVVDSGIHAFGWDRDKAITYLLDHTAMPRTQAAQEVDRYISWPGQATSYMTGYLEIHRLRAEAEKTLGARFDLRAFHDRVLGGGTVPLPVLRARVEDWIRGGGRAMP